MGPLKALCREIIENEDGLNDGLLSRIEELYEEALLAKYLSDRDAHLKRIHDKVIARAAETPAPERPGPEVSDAPVQETKTEPETPKFGDEVKVLPHPEGPPKPEKRPEPAPTETPQDTPPARNSTEELRKVLEERTVPPAPANQGNSRLSNLNIGLNDRIAFVKQLFMGSQEDYQRVVSQINTMDDYNETVEFIESVVKPDYDWSKVEETENRFLELVAHRFNK